MSHARRGCQPRIFIGHTVLLGQSGIVAYHRAGVCDRLGEVGRPPRAFQELCVSRYGWSQAGCWRYDEAYPLRVRDAQLFPRNDCFGHDHGNPMLIWMPALRRWIAFRQIETPADRAVSS